MAKLLLCGFDPLKEEDVIFLRNIVVNESGDGEKTVSVFAKWNGQDTNRWDKDWHLISLFVIIGTSALGVFLPIISQTITGLGHPIPRHIIQFLQFFGAGVIIATSLIHLFPEAQMSLSSPCLGAFSSRFGGWAGVFMMAAILTIYTTEWWLTMTWLQNEPEPAFVYPRMPTEAPSNIVGTMGTSMRTSFNPSGFALTRHGNHAALMRSRQQLLLADHTAWPVPQFHTTVKSTPELVPKHLNIRLVEWQQRFLSMPRLPDLQTPSRRQSARRSVPFTKRSSTGLEPLPEDLVFATAPSHFAMQPKRISVPEPISEETKSVVDYDLRRRAISTYLLELGIALYSVLIGLALAVTAHGFFALFVAVCFHQFFEGLALGSTLAELYWIKAQLLCQHTQNNNEGVSGEVECYKPFRTVVSLATFVPEPWQVNPVLEHAINPVERPAVLLPKREERLPGWWKAWLSALVFTATTPIGIIIGLAIRVVYEPQSQYALLLNGVLQSVCAGILVYAGLVTLMIGGLSSPQVRQLPRLVQLLLFVAVYMGAAVMAALKLWK
ncbi:hypothetical protein GGI25_004785 [Coemansia spiralis]|uniref:Uncharacterized protein n=2 Tax=Coemansia TaxID=4863 RepID=A0A9W8KWC0_9FUNG|nr:hypothetical protein EDC05_005126 [Coemansia umbellata]KAJ2620088.1 hypothetical protein GGI26_005320 [Coemansia sp. RSA 1358]KAJ2673266.1 hypothetical protein GGI25_004785 [Coemansia spiralis]